MKMNQSTRSNLDVVLSMASCEAALCAPHNLSFEMARRDTNDNIPISKLEVALNDENQPWSREVATAARKEGPAEQENCHMLHRREENEDLVTLEEVCGEGISRH